MNHPASPPAADTSQKPKCRLLRVLILLLIIGLIAGGLQVKKHIARLEYERKNALERLQTASRKQTEELMHLNARLLILPHQPDNRSYNIISGACSAFSHAFEHPQSPMGQRLKESSPFYQQYIKPKLLNIAKLSKDSIAIQACRTLLAAGEREDFIEQHLGIIAKNSSNPDSENAVKLLEKYGYPIPKPWPKTTELPSYPGKLQKEIMFPSIPVLWEEKQSLSKKQKLLLLGGHKQNYCVFCFPYKNLARIYRLNLETGAISKVDFKNQKRPISAALSRNGKTLAFCEEQAVSPEQLKRAPNGPKTKTVLVLRDAQTGEQLTEFQTSFFNNLAFAKSGRWLLAQSNDALSIFDVSQKKLKLLYRFACELSQFPPIVSSDHSQIIGLDKKGLCTLSNTYPYHFGLKADAIAPYCKSFPTLAEKDSDGKCHYRYSDQYASIGKGTLHIWDYWIFPKYYGNTFDPKPVHSYRLQLSEGRGHFKKLIFAPGNRFFLTTRFWTPSLIIWTREGKPVGQLPGHVEYVTDLKFMGNYRDGYKLLTTDWYGNLRIWDWNAIEVWCNQLLETEKVSEAPSTN